MLLLLAFYIAFHAAKINVAATNTTEPEYTSWASQPSRRGTFQLILSCLLTLILCVWTALHLNVPRDGAGAFERTMSKLKWMIFGVFAPELVVYIAYVQRADAKWLYNEVNSIRKQNSGRDAEEWTMSHSYFAAMGGFAYRTSSDQNTTFIEGDTRLLVLTTRGVQLLESVNLLPSLSEKDIEDKSKADALAKSLVCLQATWLLIQILGRLIAHLPICLLEINTAGHVFCALAIYALWWDKPLDVKVPFSLSDTPEVTPYVAMLYMYSLASSTRGGANGAVPEIDCLDYYPPNPSGYGRLATNLYDIANPHLHRERPVQYQAIQHRSSCDNLSDDLRKRWVKSNYNPEILRQAPQHVVDLNDVTRRRWRLATEAMDYIWRNQSQNRSSTHAYKWAGLDSFHLRIRLINKYVVSHQSNWVGLELPYDQANIRLFLSLATAAYGGLHAVAWNAHFPSVYERWLWIACSLFIAISGLMIFLFFGLKDLLLTLGWHKFRNSFIHWFNRYEWPYFVILTLYAVARVFLVTEAFVSLRNASVKIYDTPPWSQLIPHL